MEKLIFSTLFVLFALIRLKYHQPDRSNTQEIHAKREIFLAGQFSLILLCCHVIWLCSDLFSFADIKYSPFLQYSGAILMASGIFLLHSVHQNLGANFSARLELQEKHILIQTGPYKFVRHPMYTTGFLYLIGAGLLSTNGVVLIIPTLSFALLVTLRINDEERMLSERFPEQWSQYSKKTGRFFPKVFYHS